MRHSSYTKIILKNRLMHMHLAFQVHTHRRQNEIESMTLDLCTKRLKEAKILSICPWAEYLKIMAPRLMGFEKVYEYECPRHITIFCQMILLISQRFSTLDYKRRLFLRGMIGSQPCIWTKLSKWNAGCRCAAASSMIISFIENDNGFRRFEGTPSSQSTFQK